MIVDCGVYLHGHRGPLDGLDELSAAIEPPGAFAWVGLRMPSSIELADVCRRLGWPDLPYDDVVAPHARPVLAIDDGRVHLVLRTASYLSTQRTVQLGELSVIADPKGLVSVRFGQASPLGDLRRRLEADPGWLALGWGAVLASIVGEVVDGYQPALDGFERDVLEVERDVFSEQPRRPVKRLYQLKRDVRSLLLAISALQDPLARLCRHATLHFDDDVAAEFQETIEQLDRIVRRAESLSNLLDAALNATLAQIGVRQNDDMRKISAWVATAAAPTLIAGIYGMNFDTFPELRWRYGYPLVLGLMAVISISLVRGFRRSGWL